jgi:hypothetical protein
MKPGLLFVYFCSVSMLLDPDPHSQYGSGSTTQLFIYSSLRECGRVATTCSPVTRCPSPSSTSSSPSTLPGTTEHHPQVPPFPFYKVLLIRRQCCGSGALMYWPPGSVALILLLWFWFRIRILNIYQRLKKFQKKNIL